MSFFLLKPFAFALNFINYVDLIIDTNEILNDYALIFLIFLMSLVLFFIFVFC
jgi:hypothetical protein